MSSELLRNVTIAKAVLGGYGLAFVEGKAVFAADTIPGETADLRVVRSNSSHIFAAVETILAPSPHRITPNCPRFDVCGGCDYLHMDYETELSIKTDIIRETLMRIGKLPLEKLPPIETRHSERFGYRAIAEVKLESGRTGLYRRESNELVPFPAGGCPVLCTQLAAGIAGAEGAHGKGFRIAVGSDGVPHSTLEGSPVITEMEDDAVLEREVRGFYQANRLLRGAMRETVRRYADLGGGGSFIDIACGVGFFSLDLARRGASGAGYDIDRESIRWARHNARRNGAGSVRFEVKDMARLEPVSGPLDAIIVDPPRAGLPKKARRGIAFLEPGSIVYVSCNPATFARDARDFTAAKYLLSELTFIDMFPGTGHIELIGQFKKA